jgi:SAM-dependent methyltransferase
MVLHLEPMSAEPPSGPGPVDHPMRQVTRQIAFEPGGWTPERAAKVRDLFDGLAPEWQNRTADAWIEPLADALQRGGLVPPGVWVEVGSGTGRLSGYLAQRCGRLLAVELSGEMLRRAPADVGHRVRADGARLPLPAASVDAMVLVNAFLFPSEARRVLSPGGAVIWVSSRGPETPIYLSAEEVGQALGPGWDGIASAAAGGTWSVFRRGPG